MARHTEATDSAVSEQRWAFGTTRGREGNEVHGEQAQPHARYPQPPGNLRAWPDSWTAVLASPMSFTSKRRSSRPNKQGATAPGSQQGHPQDTLVWSSQVKATQGPGLAGG